MNKNEPNKIVKKLYKRFLELRKVTDAANYNYKAEDILKQELKEITMVVGSIEVMSKANILRLVRMQSSLRFMPEHRFYSQFVEACKFFNLED